MTTFAGKLCEFRKNILFFVKNEFLTRRQVGEAELYYRFFAWLHLVQSNIGCEFVPTGFKENRSRFLKQVAEEVQGFISPEKVIKVEGYDKIYVEKEGMIEKY